MTLRQVPLTVPEQIQDIYEKLRRLKPPPGKPNGPLLVEVDGTAVGTAAILNLIEGSGIILGGTASGQQVNITFTATGEANNHNHMGTGTDSTVLTGLLDAIQADASGLQSTAGGDGAIATGDYSAAFGDGAFANEAYGTALGHNSYVAAGATSGVAVGNQAQVRVGATFGTAIGVGAVVDTSHDSSTAIGRSAITTSINQIMLGTATEEVYFPGTAPLWIPTGAGAGKVLTSDASGHASWGTASGGGVSGFATPNLTLGTSNAAGAATTVIRSDATILVFDSTNPVTQAFGDAASPGSGTIAAYRNHKHAMPTAAITTSGLTQATARLLGRSTAATGAIEEITLGTNLSFSGTTLNATGGGSSPLTTKGDLWGYSTVDARIPIGTNGYVLTADSTQTLGLKWAAAGSGSVATDTIWDAKGDLAVGTGADTAAKLTVGADGTIPVADSTQTVGIKWQTRPTVAEYAMTGADLSLTSSLQDVAGCTVTITVDGTYFVIGVFDTDAGVNILQGQLSVGGSMQGKEAHSSSGRETVTETWVITTSGSTVVKLRAKLTASTGGKVYSGHTVMSVIGPF